MHAMIQKNTVNDVHVSLVRSVWFYSNEFLSKNIHSKNKEKNGVSSHILDADKIQEKMNISV